MGSGPLLVGYAGYIKGIAKALNSGAQVTNSGCVTHYVRGTYLLSTYAYDPSHSLSDVLAHEVPQIAGGFPLRPGLSPEFTWDTIGENMGPWDPTTVVFPEVSADGSFIFVYDSLHNEPLGVWWLGSSTSLASGFAWDMTLSSLNRRLTEIFRTVMSGSYK